MAESDPQTDGLRRRGAVRCWSLVVAVVIGLVGGMPPAAQAATCPDAIRVGLVFPLTGREGRPGTYQLEGIKLAIEQINAVGGINVKACGKRVPVKEIVYDDESKQDRSVELTQRTMSSDGVVAVLGGYSTVLGEAQSVVADRERVPWITPGAAASAIFGQGRQWIFGTLTQVDVLGYTTMTFLGSLVDQGKLPRGLKLAIVVENTDHGKDYVSGVTRWVTEHPGVFSIAFNQSFQLGGTDFSGLLQQVKAVHADIFLSDAHLQDYITMQRQYTQLGLYHRMVSYGARGPEEPARKALGRAADYIFAGTWWEKGLPYPQVRAFSRAYKTRFGHDPDSFYPATAYEGMRALAAAIEAAGSLDHTAIRDALRTVHLTDSLLPGQQLVFQKNGQIMTPFVIVQNKPEDRVDFVYPADTRTGEVVAQIPR
jgi:branched-chain amino acid transport system substrate-binding protein